MRTTGIIVIATLLVVVLPVSSWSDQTRRALVVGNGAYEDAPLRNPVNDANGIAAVLGDLGFSVTIKINVTHQEFEDAIRAFGKSLYPGDMALFYFSGHGTQVDGVNYLHPIGPPIQREHEIRYKSVNSHMILEEMEHARSSLNILILDACRINPFRGFRAIRRGLASMSAPTVPQGGTLIAHATAPDTVARDGEGKNSPYAAHLMHAMSIPGLEIEQVFKQVRVRVMAETNNQQVPWEASSLTRKCFFKPVLTAQPQREEISQPQRPAERTTYFNEFKKVFRDFGTDEFDLACDELFPDWQKTRRPGGTWGEFLTTYREFVEWWQGRGSPPEPGTKLWKEFWASRTVASPRTTGTGSGVRSDANGPKTDPTTQSDAVALLVAMSKRHHDLYVKGEKEGMMRLYHFPLKFFEHKQADRRLVDAEWDKYFVKWIERSSNIESVTHQLDYPAAKAVTIRLKYAWRWTSQSGEAASGKATSVISWKEISGQWKIVGVNEESLEKDKPMPVQAAEAETYDPNEPIYDETGAMVSPGTVLKKFGLSPGKGTWFVIVGSYLDLEKAMNQAQEINKRFKDYRAEVYEPYLDSPYYAVVVGANLTREAARELQQKAIAAGLPGGTWVRSVP